MDLVIKMNKLTILAVATFYLCIQTAAAETYSVDIWADNWFQFNVNGVKVAEDSVPITTERSFNAERFTFTAQPPFTIGLIAMDFKENNTGLEYIGTRKQQMGDGGVIAQIANKDGKVIAVTNEDWRCLVIHEAPLDKNCEQEANPIAGLDHCGFFELEQPKDWDAANFDDSGWVNAQAYTESEVRPKDGYDRVKWDGQAKLIWGPDLETNNTLLCRIEVK